MTLALCTGMFSHNLCMDYLMMQSAFDEHQCMIINFHDYSVSSLGFFIFNKSNTYLIIICAIMIDIRIMEWMVFTQFGYGLFNGAICF